MTSSPERLSEVSRLAGLLADQVLDAQIMNRPVPDRLYDRRYRRSLPGSDRNLAMYKSV